MVLGHGYSVSHRRSDNPDSHHPIRRMPFARRSASIVCSLMSDREQIAGHDGPESDQTPTGPGTDAPAQQRPPRPITRSRLISVNVLITITTVLAVVGILSIWANRLLFNADNWQNTSTQLLQNSEIRNATANYLVDQLYANVNVAGVIKTGLPPRLQPLAGPAAGALRNAAVQAVDLALTRPRVQACGRRRTEPLTRHSSRSSTEARDR